MAAIHPRAEVETPWPPRSPRNAVSIARCPVHGLHGCREICFAFECEGERDCDGRVEQVPHIAWDHAHAAMLTMYERLSAAADWYPGADAFVGMWTDALAATGPDLGAVPDAPPAS